MSEVWWGILGGFIGSAIFWSIKVVVSHYVHLRGEKTLLRWIRITFPTAKVVEVISVADSDKQVIENIERRLRDASRTL